MLKTNSKPMGYWTKEKCAEEALKYKTRTEFKNNSYYALGRAAPGSESSDRALII